MAGFIKIYRNLTKWGWYDDANTMRVFLDILLHANYQDGEYHGYPVKAGECVIGRKALAQRLGISERSVRTALEHLKSSGEVTIKTTNRFSIVTVANWEKYQVEGDATDQQNVQQLTNNRPTTDQQLTTSKKERKKERKNNNRGFTPPTLEEVRSYCSERKNKVDAETFWDFYQGKGWMVGKNKMKDWKAAVRTWEKSRSESHKSYKPEPPKYKKLEPEPERDTVQMPAEIRAKLRRIYD